MYVFNFATGLHELKYSRWEMERESEGERGGGRMKLIIFTTKQESYT